MDHPCGKPPAMRLRLDCRQSRVGGITGRHDSPPLIQRGDHRSRPQGRSRHGEIILRRLEPPPAARSRGDVVPAWRGVTAGRELIARRGGQAAACSGFLDGFAKAFHVDQNCVTRRTRRRRRPAARLFNRIDSPDHLFLSVLQHGRCTPGRQTAPLGARGLQTQATIPSRMVLNDYVRLPMIQRVV